ncbi:MAG: biotin--[acetyl-CoA-carboxylase] ligase [Rhizobiaceae bacterium]|nr:biotin--[acetyl-CoA-carboxylase] ligase [Rhizobiaceae bacterium]
MIGTPLPEPLQDFRLLKLESCVSTNTLCMDYGQAGEAGNLWIVSRQQTSGKGSRGRSWVSEPGNLFASLLLENPCEPDHLADLTFVTSVALRRALVRFAPDDAVITQKWPNDILVNGKKCSGILLESTASQERQMMVIGIGVNCVSCPGDTLHSATSLVAENIDVPPDELFDALSLEMAHSISSWKRGEGFAVIREEWLAAAGGLGKPVTVRIPGKPDIRGIFASIDEAGYMLLETSANKTERISTADVFFG